MRARWRLLVWLVRALTAVPMHSLFGLLMVSFMAVAWQDYRWTGYSALTLAVVVPIILNFSYDFLLMLHDYDPQLPWPSQVCGR